MAIELCNISQLILVCHTVANKLIALGSWLGIGSACSCLAVLLVLGFCLNIVELTECLPFSQTPERAIAKTALISWAVG